MADSWAESMMESTRLDIAVADWDALFEECVSATIMFSSAATYTLSIQIHMHIRMIRSERALAARHIDELKYGTAIACNLNITLHSICTLVFKCMLICKPLTLRA